MVKGTSRQVIVVQGPEPKLFEQAIFILRDGAPGEGITDDALLKEAQQVIRSFDMRTGKYRSLLFKVIWAAGGALAMGSVWLLTVLI